MNNFIIDNTLYSKCSNCMKCKIMFQTLIEVYYFVVLIPYLQLTRLGLLRGNNIKYFLVYIVLTIEYGSAFKIINNLINNSFYSLIL